MTAVRSFVRTLFIITVPLLGLFAIAVAVIDATAIVQQITGRQVSGEVWLVLLVLSVGAVAAVISAVQMLRAYRFWDGR